MRRLELLEGAVRDLALIAAEVADLSGDLKTGQRFSAKIIAKCAHLARLAGTIGRSRSELGVQLRSFPFNGYLIFFRYETETPDVVRVLHGSRDLDVAFGKIDSDNDD